MIFVRHPLTDAAEGLCYGRTDVGHAPVATQQMAELLQELPKVTALVSSPASRCQILAEKISARDSVAASYDPRLQEYDFGDWEGQFWNDIARDQSEHWMQDLWNNAAPGGERYRDMVTRVSEALAELPMDATIICHAGVIRAAKILLSGRSFDDVFAEKIPFCTPLELVRETA